jgi:hypothetical protein
MAAILLAAGCNGGFHCESKAKKDFRKEYPDYSITSMNPDGNDTSIVTFVIHYKKPADEKEYWIQWAYETKDEQCAQVGKGEELIWKH